MSDAERLRAFLDGWDAAERCLLDTLSWVPPEHLPFVVEQSRRRRDERQGVEP